jgi:hypothetical protein
MHGAVLGTIIVAVAIILLAGATPFLIIPVVVIGIGALVAIPILTAAADSAARPTGSAPSGVPTTAEASYDPAGSHERRNP